LGLIYLGALIVGAGIIGVQLFMSSSHDVDSGGHSDANAHGEPNHDADHSLQAGPHEPALDSLHGPVPAGSKGDWSEADWGGIAIFLSLRFWTFGLMAFGLLGCFLHYLNLASGSATAISATVLGVLSGCLAAYTFQALSRSHVNSGASQDELVGQVGRVMLPPNSEGHAKVRLSVKGQTIDYVVTSDESLEVGASVLVEEVRGAQLHVSPAPAGLKYTD
jgi:membrane protein implicated in regulation of membrane protease activity